MITFDKLAGSPVVEKLLAHPNIAEQIAEWRELGMIGEDFRLEMLTQKDLTGAPLHPQYQHLPVDTKYFTDLELEILALFEDLDAALDGWLVHSENYQALISLSRKYSHKAQCIYIDPPFNTGDDFDYLDKFQNSTWLSIMNDRLNIGEIYLKSNGALWLHLDENANTYGKELLKTHFPQIKEIINDTNATKDEEADLFGYKSFGDNFQLKHQTLFYCRKNEYFYRKLWKPNRNTTNLGLGWLDLIAFDIVDSPKKISDFDFKVEKMA